METLTPALTPLKRLRLKRGLTLMDVAKGVDSDIGNLSRIENGKQRPTPLLAERIVEFYGRRHIDEMQIIYPERYIGGA